MIKNGRYAYYKGNEFGFTRDKGRNYVIITSERKKIDDTFEDTYNSGVFSKIVELSDLDEIYEIRTYGNVYGERVCIDREKDGKYLVWTSNCEVGAKLKLDRVDKYGYEGWISADLVEIFEEREELIEND